MTFKIIFVICYCTVRLKGFMRLEFINAGLYSIEFKKWVSFNVATHFQFPWPVMQKYCGEQRLSSFVQ